MDCFAKIVKSYNHSSKSLYLRCLTGLWIHPSLNKYSLTCKVTSCYVLYETYLEFFSIIVNSNIFRHIHVLFRHIQAYCFIFRTLHNSCPLAYWEPLSYAEFSHIWSSIKRYSNIFRTLSSFYIENLALFRTLLI